MCENGPPVEKHHSFLMVGVARVSFFFFSFEKDKNLQMDLEISDVYIGIWFCLAEIFLGKIFIP